MNEAETRAEHIDPALKAAGWGVVDGSRILREHGITIAANIAETGILGFDACYPLIASLRLCRTLLRRKWALSNICCSRSKFASKP